MKLIIDIPEEDYKGICHLKNEQLRMLPVEVAETLIRIANGTPLDKHDEEIIATTVESIWGKPPYTDMLDNLRAEIEQAKSFTCKTEDGQEFITSADFVIYPDKRYFTSGLDKALEIIDKYMGGGE